MADHSYAQAGLKTFASVNLSRQLGERTSAGIGAIWQPAAGLGLQLVSSRSLSDTTDADFNWVLGPAGAAGVGLSLSRRGERLTTSARVEVSCWIRFTALAQGFWVSEPNKVILPAGGRGDGRAGALRVARGGGREPARRAALRQHRRGAGAGRHAPHLRVQLRRPGRRRRAAGMCLSFHLHSS